jgi:hypothetical protein
MQCGVPDGEETGNDKGDAEKENDEDGDVKSGAHKNLPLSDSEDEEDEEKLRPTLSDSEGEETRTKRSKQSHVISDSEGDEDADEASSKVSSGLLS